MRLKKCPCGKIPTELFIEPQGTTAGKWGYVCGNCCGEWLVQFRLKYLQPHTDDAIALAVEAWNNAPRGFISKIPNVIADILDRHDIGQTIVVSESNFYAMVNDLSTLCKYIRNEKGE